MVMIDGKTPDNETPQSTTPVSEVLNPTQNIQSGVLSDAEVEERESHRLRSDALDAWEDHPGDSQNERDYTAAELEEKGYDTAADPEYRPLLTVNQSEELVVETTVYFPDGRRISVSEAREISEATDEDALELVRKVNRITEFRFNA